MNEGQTRVEQRYVLEQLLGRGGMGHVYLAHDEVLRRHVALKVIAPEWVDDRKFRDAFAREARALAALRHDHVVRIYDAVARPECTYLTMERVPGRLLSTLMEQHLAHGATLPPFRALTILQQIAGGLAAVHAAGIVHRDVKPENVIIEEGSGRPVLIDFGIASKYRVEEEPAGTPAYLAPEVIFGGPADPTADVYSLGCMAFELLTGRLPFEHENLPELYQAHLGHERPLVSSRRPELGSFDLVVQRAMARRAADRYTSALEFAAALGDAMERWSRGETLPEPARESSDALRILVIDDDDDFRKLAARAAQLALYQQKVLVSTARTGVEALAIARRTPPDVVILDYDMPGLDGIDTLSRLRAIPKGGDARVIVVSATVTDAVRWRFGILGVEDFFGKTEGFAGLVGRILEVMNRYGWARAETR